MFLDRVKIHVRAGDGGDGAASFRREAHVPRGGPDGGDGGRGGSVYLSVDVGETTLTDYRFKHHFQAPAGGRGAGTRKHGRAGVDLELVAPPGTSVYDDASGDLLADLVAAGQRVLVARGGRGGLGNVHFATATHRAPRHAQKGEPAEERWLRLELRLIADVGLVGLPNAGKSTLLAALTAATPRIAPYPFTTLEPNLGVLDLAAFDPHDERRPTIADVPGLIEGASSGAGLGHAFLRHVERTRLLIHVVDLAGSDPERDFGAIREELRLHDPRLLDKPTLIAANKLDEPTATANLAAFLGARGRERLPTVAVAGLTGLGIPDLARAIATRLPDAASLARPPESSEEVVHRPLPIGVGFAIERDGEAFRIRGRRVERLAAQTDFENEESAERFQHDLARLGVERELRRAGVSEGDVVRIGSQELIWEAGAWS
ncbi:MAG TPA: GTPase ObgE [Candidatus Limnocylindrales bacterium]|jgi:GTP-binding protein|nr:GTPase ObgE [Candidatus Limnocylindrales bacterium]